METKRAGSLRAPVRSGLVCNPTGSGVHHSNLPTDLRYTPKEIAQLKYLKLVSARSDVTGETSGRALRSPLVQSP